MCIATSGRGCWSQRTTYACAMSLIRGRSLISRQVPLPLVYKEVKLDCGYRMDNVVNGELILEIKAVERLLPIHEAQMLTYLRLSGIRTGLLMNFNTPILKQGLRRMTHR